MDKERQKKISLTFRSNEKELELYEWLLSKGEFVGVAGAIKQMLNKIMEEERKEVK